MHCSARDKYTDDDRSLITWTRKDGLPLPVNRSSVEGGNLTLASLTAEDRGVYVCNALNEAAKIETDAELMIETFSPKAPSNLTANSSSNTITMWVFHRKFQKKSFNESIIRLRHWTQNYVRPDLKFSIWFRPIDAQEWRTHQVKSNYTYQSTIRNLEPGREYEFMVLSQDRYNDGLFSKPFRYRTKG